MGNEHIQQIVSEYKEALRNILKEKLQSGILFGSQARADARQGSDIDILCVINEPFDYGEMIKLTSEITAAISLKYGVVLSRTFASERDTQKKQLPFFMNIRREGIAA